MVSGIEQERGTLLAPFNNVAIPSPAAKKFTTLKEEFGLKSTQPKRLLIKDLRLSAKDVKAKIKEQLQKEDPKLSDVKAERKAEKLYDAKKEEIREHYKYKTRMADALTKNDAAAFKKVQEDLKAEYGQENIIFVYDGAEFLPAGAGKLLEVQPEKISQQNLNGFDFTGNFEYLNIELGHCIIKDCTFNLATFLSTKNLPENQKEEFKAVDNHSVFDNCTFVQQEPLWFKEKETLMVDVRSLPRDARSNISSNERFIDRQNLPNNSFKVISPLTVDDYDFDTPFFNPEGGSYLVNCGIDMQGEPEDIECQFEGVTFYESEDPEALVGSLNPLDIKVEGAGQGQILDKSTLQRMNSKESNCTRALRNARAGLQTHNPVPETPKQMKAPKVNYSNKN